MKLWMYIKSLAQVLRRILSYIVSAPIGNDVRKYRVRGIVNYGLLRALVLYAKVRRDKTTPQYKLSVCAIAKNEGRYFAEWIEYHRLVGVEKFYIYDNESDDNTKQILQPYIESGLVEYTFIAGQRKQLPAYSDCLHRHRFDSQWIAFVDIDEFIVPVKDESISDFLAGYTDYAVVQVNWLCYGSAGREIRTPGLVIERFTDHSEYDSEVNYHIKSIVQPKRVIAFSGAHECVRLFGKAVDVNKKVVTESSFVTRPVGQDIIRVNHYAVKSYEEFLEKRDRGRARPGKKRGDGYFKRFDQNQIKNDPVMDKYIPVIKQRLEKNT